jgi:hypothetical protein
MINVFNNMKTIYCKPETKWLELTDGYSLMDDVVTSVPVNDNEDDEEANNHDQLLSKPSYSVWDDNSVWDNN